MKIVCPKNKTHNKFNVTAHVAQLWEVDQSGEFIKELESCTEVDHQPDEDDLFYCQICGEQAKVEK